MINRGKISKRLNEVKPIKKIKNLQIFPEISPACAKGSPSFTYTTRPCICVIESFWIKEKYPHREIARIN